MFNEICDTYSYSLSHVITEAWNIDFVCAHTFFDYSKALLGVMSVLLVLNHSQWFSHWDRELEQMKRINYGTDRMKDYKEDVQSSSVSLKKSSSSPVPTGLLTALHSDLQPVASG